MIDQQDTRTDRQNRQDARTDTKPVGTPRLMTERTDGARGHVIER